MRQSPWPRPPPTSLLSLSLSLHHHHHLHLARSLSFTLPPLLPASFPACLLAVDPPSAAPPICLTVEFLSNGVAAPTTRRPKSEGSSLTGSERRGERRRRVANDSGCFVCEAAAQSARINSSYCLNSTPFSHFFLLFSSSRT